MKSARIAGFLTMTLLAAPALASGAAPPPAAPVPEPGAALLLGAGLFTVGLAARALKKR